MSNLWLFCPENDVALAFEAAQHRTSINQQGMTPPAAAWQLHLCGEAIPMWMGKDEDRFLTYGINQQWLEKTRRDFGIGMDIFERDSQEIFVGSPWGWSFYTERLYRDFDAHLSNFPTDPEILILRELSSRRSSIALNNALSLNFPTPVKPVEIFSMEEFDHYKNEYGDYVVKSLWSSSGRGVLSSTAIQAEPLRKQIQGLLNRYGSVVIEKHLDRVLDFAMLFDYSQGKAQYMGLSVFDTSDRGDYHGNRLASQSELTQAITSLVNPSWLDEVRKQMTPALEDYLKDNYNGLLGVDMMVYRCENGESNKRGEDVEIEGEDGHLSIAPCIELNLRPTLGHTALLFTERYLKPGVRATLKVEKGNVESDYITEDHRLSSGKVALSPGRNVTFTVEVNP